MQSIFQHPREPPYNGTGAEGSVVLKEVSGHGTCGQWSTAPKRTPSIRVTNGSLTKDPREHFQEELTKTPPPEWAALRDSGPWI